jgi:hypothetical protein
MELIFVEIFAKFNLGGLICITFKYIFRYLLVFYYMRIISGECGTGLAKKDAPSSKFINSGSISTDVYDSNFT